MQLLATSPIKMRLQWAKFRAIDWRKGAFGALLQPKTKKNSVVSVLIQESDSLLAMADGIKPAGRTRTPAAKPENYGSWGAGFGDFLSQDGQHTNPKITDTAAGAMVSDYYGYKMDLCSFHWLSPQRYHRERVCRERLFGMGLSSASMGQDSLAMAIFRESSRRLQPIHMERNVVVRGPLSRSMKSARAFVSTCGC